MKENQGTVLFKQDSLVVIAWDESTNFVYDITAYIPDMEHFQENGITRKERE
jgi:hypothetical protein